MELHTANFHSYPSLKKQQLGLCHSIDVVEAHEGFVEVAMLFTLLGLLHMFMAVFEYLKFWVTPREFNAFYKVKMKNLYK